MNNRKTEFVKLIAKALFLFAFVYGVWVFYIENFKEYYNSVNNTRWEYFTDVFEGKEPITLANVLFLGESRVNSNINFTQIPGAWSFAAGGSSAVEQYCMLKKYLQKFPKPDTVYISISPRFLRSTYAFWHLAVRNDFFSAKEFTEIIETSKKAEADTFPEYFAKAKFYAYKYRWFPYYQTDVQQNFLQNTKAENTELRKYAYRNKGAQPHPGLNENGCSDLFVEAAYTNFAVPPILDFYFNAIFETCSKHGIYVIFESMPFNETSFKKLSPIFVEEYTQYIKNYANKYPNFNINSSVYAYPDSLFGDPSHLNSKGKQVFTDSLKIRHF